MKTYPDNSSAQMGQKQGHLGHSGHVLGENGTHESGKQHHNNHNENCDDKEAQHCALGVQPNFSLGKLLLSIFWRRIWALVCVLLRCAALLSVNGHRKVTVAPPELIVVPHKLRINCGRLPSRRVS